jgi:hypothetical protein
LEGINTGFQQRVVPQEKKALFNMVMSYQSIREKSAETAFSQ